MLCWTSKGLINITRDSHQGILKNQQSTFNIISILCGNDRVLELKYSHFETQEFETDFKNLKECFLNTFQGSSVRLFNPPTGEDPVSISRLTPRVFDSEIIPVNLDNLGVTLGDQTYSISVSDRASDHTIMVPTGHISNPLTGSTPITITNSSQTE